MITNNKKPDDNLADPLLSALLREAFADDPELAPSPGRHDRIMRKIMSSGVRPVTRPRWTPFAWVAGACAAAALLLLLLGGGKEEQPNVVINPKPAVQEEIIPEAPKNSIALTPDNANTVVPTPAKKLPVRIVKNHQHTIVRDIAVKRDVKTHEMAHAYLAIADSAVQMGDYATAYDAYNAAYKVEPSSVTLMASANALERMVEETAAM